MASASHPGGGYRKGAGAQEENLHRRTNLFQCLEDPYQLVNRSWSYPLPQFGGIYVRDAIVICSSENEGYAFLPQPQKMSFIGSFAYKDPPTETNSQGQLVLSKKIAKDMKKKIHAIFEIALSNNHDSIVLSAFGCGAYGNPPNHIAELFKDVIQEFRGHFKCIIFSILDDDNTGKSHNPLGNLLPFANTFQTTVLTLQDLFFFQTQ